MTYPTVEASSTSSFSTYLLVWRRLELYVLITGQKSCECNKNTSTNDLVIKYMYLTINDITSGLRLPYSCCFSVYSSKKLFAIDF